MKTVKPEFVTDLLFEQPMGAHLPPQPEYVRRVRVLKEREGPNTDLKVDFSLLTEP